MTWYTPHNQAFQQTVADEDTGRTVAVVYTSREDAVLIAYAPKMLEIVKEYDPRLYAEIIYEQETP